MLENLPVILVEVDRHGVYTFCRGAGFPLWGKRPEDFLGYTIAQVFPGHPDLPENHRRALSGSAFSVTVEADGRTWNATYRPMRATDGEVVGFTCLALDVTDTVRAAAERQATEARLRLVTRSIPMILLAANRKGIVTLAEGNGLAALGLEPATLTGRSLESVFPDSAPTIRRHYRRVLSGEEFGATLALGGRSWETRYVPMRDARDQIDGFCWVALDVTERVRSEGRFEASSHREAGVAELSRAALAGAGLQDLMQAAVALLARELPGTDYVALGEVEPAGIRRLAAVADPAVAVPSLLEPDPAVYAVLHAVRAGDCMTVADWSTERRIPQPQWLRDAHIKSSVFLPIVTYPEEHVFGIVGAHSRQHRVFLEHEVTFIETVANLLGDVITRQRAQDTAARQAEQFRALAENSPDVICRFDHDLRLLYINGVVERLIGLPANSIIGCPLRAAGKQVGLAETRIASLELALRQVLRSGAQQAMYIESDTVQGPRTFHVSMAPEQDGIGAVQSVLVAARDVTDRQMADQERALIYQQLLAQQEQIRQLLANLVDGQQPEHLRTSPNLQLSTRERQILNLLARGWTNRDIAADLALSRGNVKNQVSKLLRKLDVTDRTQAAAEAVRLKLVDPRSSPSDR